MSDPIDRLKKSLPQNYQLLGFIGGGGQGKVFRGLRDGTPIAIKIFTSPDQERLKREIDLLSCISCDYLVKMKDYRVLDIDGCPAHMVAYELIEGEDLSVIFGRNVILAAEQITKIGHNIGVAVECIWAKRIVHRDVKPANIIASADGRYVLVDIGFAQHLDLSTITMGGHPGTNGYRSPEQAAGRRHLTIHSDIFSLGVTIFELAAQSHPWDRRQPTGRDTLQKQLDIFRPDLDRRLTDLIHDMMQVRPSRRPLTISSRFQNIGGGKCFC